MWEYLETEKAPWVENRRFIDGVFVKRYNDEVDMMTTFGTASAPRSPLLFSRARFHSWQSVFWAIVLREF